MLMESILQIFKQDIERLLSMEDMWKHRKQPVPIDYDELEKIPTSSQATNGHSGIRDQKVLSLKDSFDLFLIR